MQRRRAVVKSSRSKIERQGVAKTATASLATTAQATMQRDNAVNENVNDSVAWQRENGVANSQ